MVYNFHYTKVGTYVFFYKEKTYNSYLILFHCCYSKEEICELKRCTMYLPCRNVEY